nr:uncharacterized protein LOC109413728 [Aedes albopictus]
MQQPIVLYSGSFATHQQYANGISAAPSGSDPNLQFFKQTFQQPLQYGLPGYEQTVEGTNSTASTKPWPSDENFDNNSSSSSSVEVAPDLGSIADMLPIQDFQHLADLENRIASVQQYESLLSQLQLLSVRCNGLLNEMLRNFIADPVLGRIGFARTKNGKYHCTMRNDLQRIMMAIKACWFPTLSQNAFEMQLGQLLKNAHSRYKFKPNDSPGEPLAVNSPASSKDQEAPLNFEGQSVTVHQPIVPVQAAVMAAPQPQDMHMFLQNQWYRYAVYYRDRYQVARKANLKMKTDFAEQEKDNRKRISACRKRIRTMERYMDALEKRLRRTD